MLCLYQMIIPHKRGSFYEILRRSSYRTHGPYLFLHHVCSLCSCSKGCRRCCQSKSHRQRSSGQQLPKRKRSRSSQDTDPGFNIYTEESNYNYDDTSDSTDDTAASDQTTYDPRTYSSDDTTSSDVVDEGTAEDGSYDSSDQIDYPSDDNNGDTPDDNNDYDSSQDNGDYSEDAGEEGSSDNTDSASFDIVTQDSNY